MLGRDHSNPHRVFPGNRPSTTLIYDRLSPFRLGQIVAAFVERTPAQRRRAGEGGITAAAE